MQFAVLLKYQWRRNVVDLRRHEARELAGLPQSDEDLLAGRAQVPQVATVEPIVGNAFGRRAGGGLCGFLPECAFDPGPPSCSAVVLVVGFCAGCLFLQILRKRFELGANFEAPGFPSFRCRQNLIDFFTGFGCTELAAAGQHMEGLVGVRLRSRHPRKRVLAAAEDRLELLPLRFFEALV